METYKPILGLPLYGYYFVGWDKRSIRDFWKDIIAHQSERILQLNHLINQDNEFKNLKLDYSPHSLIPLGEWLKNHIAIQPKSKELYDIEAVRLGDMDTPSPYEFTPMTLSICLDISLYYGNIILNKLGDRTWHINTNVAQSNLNYGALGIKGNVKNVVFYPLKYIIGACTKAINGKFDPGYLFSLYEIQIKMINAKS